MKRDSIGQTFAVAAILCVVCSVVVSAAAVGLRPLQLANKKKFERKNILAAAGISLEGTTIDDAFESIETLIIDLESGEVVSSDVVDPETYDQRKAARDPAFSIEIPADQDVGGIRRREKYSRVYIVRENGEIQKVVLPVYGRGLWSTLYGFIALEGDMNTVAGLTFYQHGETAGLGGEVDNPSWKAKWPGKSVYDSSGEVQIEVLKGAVDPSSSTADYQVDGLSGATITSRGVSRLLQYWLADHGFKPFLEKLKSEPSNG